MELSREGMPSEGDFSKESLIASGRAQAALDYFLNQSADSANFVRRGEKTTIRGIFEEHGVSLPGVEDCILEPGKNPGYFRLSLVDKPEYAKLGTDDKYLVGGRSVEIPVNG